jgi:hypothetical protein
MPELLFRGIQGSFFPPSMVIENQGLLDVHAIHFILASLKNINSLFIDLNNACLDIGLTKFDIGSLFRIMLNHIDMQMAVTKMLKLLMLKEFYSLLYQKKLDQK